MVLREIAAKVGVSIGRVSQWKSEGMPLSSWSEASGWLKAHYPERAILSGLIIPEPVAADASGLVERLEESEQRCYRLVKSTDNPVMLNAYLRGHAMATQILMDARKAELEDRTRRGELIEAARVRGMLQQLDGSLVTLIGAMPRALAPRLLPHDPFFAEGILREWGNNLLKTLHDGRDRGLGELAANTVETATD
jgi:hypothetical protein